MSNTVSNDGLLLDVEQIIRFLLISIFKTAVSLQKIGSGVCYFIISYDSYDLLHIICNISCKIIRFVQIFLVRARFEVFGKDDPSF